jgi:hypothetical protein
MAVDLRSQNEPALPRGAIVTRRSVFGIGTSVIAALAALSSPISASADCQNSPCCCLASCTRCSLNPCGGWYCPSGYNATCWNCTSGGKWYVCGECSQGSDCYHGPWACSIWFQQSSPGCPYTGC